MGFRNPLTSLSADQITPGVLPVGVIAQALADGTVTPQALADDAVTGPKIATGAVLADAIGAGQVFAAAISAGAITADKLGAQAVTAQKMAVGVLASNLLRNPGFEDTGEAMPTPGVRSSVPGWLLVAGPDSAGENFRYGNDAFPPASGNGYALLTNDGTGGAGSSLFQSTPAIPGYQYRAAVRARTSGGEANNRLLIAVWQSYDFGVTWPSVDYTITPPLTAAYVEYGYTTTTMLAGWTTLRYEVRHFGNNGAAGGAGAVLVDDCTLIRRGSPAVEITPAGIRMWNSAGNLTIHLEGEGGAATVLRLNALAINTDGNIHLGMAQLSGREGALFSALFSTFGFKCDPGYTSTFGPVDCTAILPDLTATTSPANIYAAASGAALQRVSSLRRYKLDREPIAAHYELLDVPAVTWRDAGAVAADPDTAVRVPGFVAEDVAAVSAAAGGAFDALLTREPDGQLQGLAYDRWPAYLTPILADMHARLRTLEETQTP